MKDLIEKLNQLAEAKVQPGERKEISFKLNRLDKIGKKLKDYKNSLYHMELAGSVLPSELKIQMDEIKSKLDQEISQVDAAYKAVFEKASGQNNTPVKMENLFKALKKNCKQIIKVYQQLNGKNITRDHFMWRGIRSSADALYGKPFDARKPKDSNSDTHQLVDDAIRDAGFEATRSNAMFVTGDRSQASGYGHSLYVMFPVDGFKFTWSKSIKDLVLDYAKKLELLDRDVANEIKAILRKVQDEVQESNPNSFPFGYIDAFFTVEYDLSKSISKIEGYFSDKPGETKEKITELLANLITTESIMDHLQLTDNDLYTAIKSKHEIYMRGDYYAVNINHLGQLRQFLKDVDVGEVDLPDSFGDSIFEVFDKGDVVKVIGGNYKGKIGVISYEYADGDTFDVQFGISKSGSSSEGVIKEQDLQLYKLPDGTAPSFDSGQRVIVTNPDSPRYGKTLVVDYNQPGGKLVVKDGYEVSTLYKSEIAPYSTELDEKIQAEIAANIKKQTNTSPLKQGDEVRVIDSDNKYYDITGIITYEYESGNMEVALSNGEVESYSPADLKLVEKNSTTPTSSKFETGDKVKIIAGEWKDYYGEIKKLEPGSNDTIMAEVNISGLNVQYDIPTSSLAHVKQNAEDDSSGVNPNIKFGSWIKVLSGPHAGKLGQVANSANSNTKSVDILQYQTGNSYSVPARIVQVLEFDKGQKVKIIDGPGKGKTGIISYVYSSYPEVEVEFEDGTSREINLLNIQLLSSNSDDSPIKVGDKVEIINSDSSMYKEIGKVVEVDMTDGVITLSFPSKRKFKTFLDWVKKVDSSKIQVGDEVINIQPGHSNYGKTGTVKTVYSSGNIGLVYSDGTQAIDPPNFLQKIDHASETEKAPVLSFKKGDKVKVINKSYAYDGKKGTVAYGPDDDGDYQIITTDSKILYCSPNQLELQSEEKSTNFKVGDKVKVINDDSSFFGSIGEITKIYDTLKAAAVTFSSDNDPVTLYKFNEIEHVTDSESATTSTPLQIGDVFQITDTTRYDYGKFGKVDYIYPSGNYGFEYTDGSGSGGVVRPDQIKKKDLPSSKPPIEKGDRVKVTGMYQSLIGKTGTVMDIVDTQNTKFVSVWLDGNTTFSSFPFSAIEQINMNEDPRMKQTTSDFDIGDIVLVVDPALQESQGKTYKVIDIASTYVKCEHKDKMTKLFMPTSIVKIKAARKAAAQTPILVGDIVTANDPYIGLNGENGKVIKIGKMGNIDFSVVYVGNKEYSVNNKFIKLWFRPTENSDLSIGDKVQVIDSKSEHFGVIGDVIDQDIGPYGNGKVKVATYSDTFNISPHSIVKVN